MLGRPVRAAALQIDVVGQSSDRTAERRANGVGKAKVNHCRDGLSVILFDEDLARPEIPVDDPFLMAMLHRLADRNHQFDPLLGRELVFVAILCDRDTRGEIHREKDVVVRGRVRVERPGDVPMFDGFQHLPLSEAFQDLLVIAARLQHLDGDAAFGMRLVGNIDAIRAPFAKRIRDGVLAAN